MDQPTQKKIYYHPDENCRNVRLFIPSLIELHKLRGLYSRILVTQSDITEETGCLDLDVFQAFAAKRDEFLVTNTGTFEVYPPTHESRRYREKYKDIVDLFVGYEDGLAMPEEVEKEVKLWLHRFLRNMNPQELAELCSFDPDAQFTLRAEKAESAELELAITGEPEDELVDRLTLNAFHKSLAFKKFIAAITRICKEDDGLKDRMKPGITDDIKGLDIRPHKKNKDLFYSFDTHSFNVADRERDNIILSDFEKEGGSAKTDVKTSHVVITNDPGHMRELQITIGTFGRSTDSFVMFAEEFKESCRLISAKLKEANKLETVSIIAGLDQAYTKVNTQYDGKPKKNYVNMIVSGESSPGESKRGQ